jgi:hypothetical protein
MRKNILGILLVCFLGLCHASETTCDDAPPQKPESVPETASDFDKFFCHAYIDKKCSLYEISFINLIATPERFLGKRVRVIAYLDYGFERASLYLAPGVAYTEAIRINIFAGADGKNPFSKDLTQEEIDGYLKRSKEIEEKFDGRKVLVEGTFRKPQYSIYNRGELYDISVIKRP